MNNKNFFLVNFYVIEIIYRLFYIFISLCICVLISFQYVEPLLLIETYPFLKFSNKKFIITHTTDLINSIWYLIFSTSVFMVFPIFFYQIIQFSKTSWYGYQVHFSKKLFFMPLIACYICIFLCYFKLFPLILNFLTQWELTQTRTFLNIEIEFRILNYINWILVLRYCFCFLSYFFMTIIMQLLSLVFLKNIYWIMKFHRKKFCFLSILILFILAPPDIFLQFFIILISFLFYEIIFFNVCYKVYNSKF